MDVDVLGDEGDHVAVGVCHGRGVGGDGVADDLALGDCVVLGC